MTKPPKPKLTPRDFAQADAAATTRGQEVAQQLYQALLNVPSLQLKDGTEAHVQAYYPPQLNEAGEVECGVDVRLPDGHLEFTIRNSGWGKSFMQQAGKNAARRARGR